MKSLNKLFLALVLIAGCSRYNLPRWNPLHSPWIGSLPGHAVRISTWDKTGANRDSIKVLPGETVTLADVSGPGIIRRIWMTSNTKGPIGRTLVLRMYWDGLDTPAVEVPFGDFFGVGNGMEAEVYSWPITVVSRGRSRNCWWPMPFAKGARITITNEGTQPHSAFYCHIDYLALDEPPPTHERFHAQYRQAYPADFPGNYTILDTEGAGQYAGTVMSVAGTKPQWWGEGDELIEVDDYEPLHGTGTEDYFCDAWGMHTHSTLWHGSPVCEGYAETGLRTSMYRFHILDPIPFKKRIKVSIEHGTQNNRADNLSSVAFWYQVPPASFFPPLPPLENRLLGKERVTFVRKCAWQIATSESPEANQKLKRLLSLAKMPENKTLVEGLLVYVDGLQSPTDSVINNLDKVLTRLDELVNAQQEDERYTKPKIDIPTDDDNLIPSSVVAVYRTLELARRDLARKVALRRGLLPGDEIMVEARDPRGIVTPPPVYKETPDFTNSYAKVDDTHLMGKGARFTYGNADPSWARFTPDFPRAGRYEVLVIFSYGSNADDTRYEVRYAEGVKIVPLKQRGRPGTPGRNNRTWHSLGGYRFEAGQNPDKGSVTLHASPGTAIPNDKFEYRAYSDSVQFVFMGE